MRSSLKDIGTINLISVVRRPRYGNTDSGKPGGIMKVEAQPSDREVLAGLVERVTYQNADNGFCVVRVKHGAIAIW
jgi:hypothetical protein